VVVSNLTDAVGISAGPDFTCAVRSAGTVVCWGSTALGYIAVNPIPNPSPLPAAVVGVTNVEGIATALGSTCALFEGGNVSCWSRLSGSVTVTAVPELTGSVAIANGVTECGLLPDGKVICTGGFLASSITVAGDATAITVASSSIDAAVGSPIGCALVAGGSIQCWQTVNGPGAGLGSAVVPLAAATAVATSGAHTCAVLADTTVACWGDNLFGELGNGTTEDSETPVPVSNLSGVTALATGWYHTCAVLADGTGACWGNNQLRSNEGGITDATTPVTVTF
jgi:hypothetical protein